MELTILGSGTYQPELKRHCSSYLVEIGKEKLLFDIGRGALDQLMRIGVTYAEVDRIFITHFHSDHTSELAAFLYIALHEPAKGKFRQKPLTICGPKGTKKAIKYINLVHFGTIRKPAIDFTIKELKQNGIKSRNWIVESYPVKHSDKLECLSYRLESRGKVISYSGDTEDCPSLRKSCQNADIAIIEASWPEELEPRGHLAAEKAGRIAQECGVKKLVLTHVAPYYLKNYDIKKLAQKYYKGPTIIAKDLMRIEI